ncbi:MAG TPA: hypothetical protein VIL44_05955, partial [Micromonospora sp.]
SSPAPTRAPTTTAVVLQPPIPPPPPAPTVTEERIAVDCRGQPDGATVLAVLRQAQVLPSWATATAQLGPLCAGDWQYTELRVPGREPLLVVTQGTPPDLALVAAGTDVCTARVRAVAPAGIRSRACDAPSSETSAPVR